MSEEKKSPVSDQEIEEESGKVKQEPTQEAPKEPVSNSEETTTESKPNEEPSPSSISTVAESPDQHEEGEDVDLPSEQTGADPNHEEEHEEEEEEEHEEPLEDYSQYGREELVKVIEALSKEDGKFKRSDAILEVIVPLFDNFESQLKATALEKFIEEGGEEDDFEYRHDDLYNRFDASLRLVKDKKAKYYKEKEATRQRNLEKKNEILDRLRELVDGENPTTSIAIIKAIQEEWKNIGPIPGQFHKTLWANYNALMDRFYSNRHILFELKDLDRKKNQLIKEELCEKAEKLDELEDLKEAVIQLNELHQEYKQTGPVPREIQEELWQRFKAASDKIYLKRREYSDAMKVELFENLEKKRALAERIQPFVNFTSDRINEWNAKNKEVLDIQKQWEAIGGLPREHAKDVNKQFWSAVKKFFSTKREFFKKLEEKRYEHLELKKVLVAEAEALKDNTDWDKTAEAIKELQQRWKEIGPVPEKFRNAVYEEFKAACDHFFNNKRANLNEVEASYVENLKVKEELCTAIEAKANQKEGVTGDLDGFIESWQAIGFVPRNALKSIEEKFQSVLSLFIDSLGLPDEEKETLSIKVELSALGRGANADNKLYRKEGNIRKQIQQLEDDISLWNNNLAFFANSKTADKLKAEFDEKIAKANEQLTKLKKQLKVIRSI